MLKKQSAKTKSKPKPAGGEAPGELLAVPHGYSEFLANLKAHIHASQVKTALAVNNELVLLFWEIGKRIVERQDKEEWGAAVIEKLASDLRKEFPDIKGFSARNIWRMRAFYLAYTRNLQILPQPAAEIDGTNLPQVAAQIPWFHNVILIEKVKDIQERLWYIHQALEHGWSRNILALQIDNDLYHRDGRAVTNFGRTLPSPQSRPGR